MIVLNRTGTPVVTGEQVMQTFKRCGVQSGRPLVAYFAGLLLLLALFGWLGRDIKIERKGIFPVSAPNATELARARREAPRNWAQLRFQLWELERNPEHFAWLDFAYINARADVAMSAVLLRDEDEQLATMLHEVSTSLEVIEQNFHKASQTQMRNVIESARRQTIPNHGNLIGDFRPSDEELDRLMTLADEIDAYIAKHYES